MGSFTFSAKLWRYDTAGPGAWYFVTLPKEYTEEIKARSSDFLRGFGSVKVTATVGKTSWQTSIFPDSKSGSYFLPIKKDIRIKENLAEDSTKEFIVLLI